MASLRVALVEHLVVLVQRLVQLSVGDGDMQNKSVKLYCEKDASSEIVYLRELWRRTMLNVRVSNKD